MNVLKLTSCLFGPSCPPGHQIRVYYDYDYDLGSEA